MIIYLLILALSIIVITSMNKSKESHNHEFTEAFIVEGFQFMKCNKCQLYWPARPPYADMERKFKASKIVSVGKLVDGKFVLEKQTEQEVSV